MTFDEKLGTKLLIPVTGASFMVLALSMIALVLDVSTSLSPLIVSAPGKMALILLLSWAVPLLAVALTFSLSMTLSKTERMLNPK